MAKKANANDKGAADKKATGGKGASKSDDKGGDKQAKVRLNVCTLQCGLC